MKKILLSIILFVSLSISFGLAEYFYIGEYDVDIDLEQNALIHIVEKIDVVFTSPRHGIIRSIPYKYSVSDDEQIADLPNQFGSTYNVVLNNIKVQGHNYEVYKENGMVNIKIGDADKYVSGPVHYEISYDFYGGINFFENHTEFYWDVIGDQWDNKINLVNFNINLPKSINLKKEDFFVYHGFYGQKENKVNIQKTDQKISGTLYTGLQPNQALTVGIKFPVDYFVRDKSLERYYRWINNSWWVITLSIMFIILITLYIIWYRVGKDKEPAYIVEYAPPKDIAPSQSNMILYGKVVDKDVLSIVYSLAIKGYLIVFSEERKKFLGLGTKHEVSFIRKKPKGDKLINYEQTVYEGIFQNKNDKEVKAKDLSKKFYTYLNSAKSEIKEYTLIQGLYTDKSVTYSRWMFLIPFYNRWILKRTKKGDEMYAQLKGFKEFVKTVEKDKLKRMVDQDPKYFDKTLPFAIALGYGDAWVKKFDGLLDAPPEWTSGVVSYAAFSSAMHNGMNSMYSSMRAYPSGGGSGFSGGGGGFSGGGMGGGGGSSW